MTKQYQGWHTTTPRKMEFLPPLPRVIGREFTIKAQPNLPHYWSIAKVNFVGVVGKCVYIRRQWSPPYLPIIQLEILLEGHAPLYWDFVESQIEAVS